MAEAWNILDDFCEPVCAMLSFHGVLAGKSINLLFPDGGLACVWLDVNVSVGVGDKVRGLLEAVINGEPDAAEKAIRYMRRLGLVLRQRKGEEIPKEQNWSEWRGAYKPGQLWYKKRRTGLLGIGQSAFYSRKKRDPKRYQHAGGGTWLIHASLLPSE